MATGAPLTLAEKEWIYAEKIRGLSLSALAAELGCSRETDRKWWRTARDQGRVALRQPRRGRAATGVLSPVPPAVTSYALLLTHAHPTWGPDRILTDLQHDTQLSGLPLPGWSRLAVLFTIECPDLVAPRRPPATPPTALLAPTVVHECWHLDC